MLFHLVIVCLGFFVSGVKAELDIRASDDISVTKHYSSSEYEGLDRVQAAKAYLHGGTLVCELKCQQGTVFYSGDSCKCICRKNYALYKSTQCIPASWSRWSSWTNCLSSDWGGLQQRERICKARGRDFPGACDGRGSIARTCSPITKGFKHRKNVRDLNDEEFHDILQAMTKYKKDKSKTGYWNIASWHGFPGRCPWYHHIDLFENNHCSWHNHPMFQPWHRLMIVQWELGLSRYLKNKTIGIPYWDWTEQATDIPYLVRNPRIYDPILKKYIRNPFHTTFIKWYKGVRIYNQRNPYYPALLNQQQLLSMVLQAMICHDFYQYDKQLRLPHDQIHECFCINKQMLGENVCDYGMSGTYYSSFEPAFMLHHCAMDRLFVIRRKLEEINGVADWTKSRVIGQYTKAQISPSNDVTEAFDWPMSPFCNRSMNPDPVTGRQGVWVMRNAFYEEQLFGYKYDNFDFGLGYTWEDLQSDFRRNVIDRRFWNDDYYVTKLGNLTNISAAKLNIVKYCVIGYSVPPWSISIKWN